MSQDKSISSKSNSIAIYQKRTYKLKGISYMSLSLMYIALILVTLITGLVLLAFAAASGHILGLLITAIITGAIIFALISIGTKYGQYGLEIIIGKSLQRKHIKNDFPRIEQSLLGQLELFPNSTLVNNQDSSQNSKKDNSDQQP